MARKPRVHEVAAELGVDAKVAMRTLKSLGLFVKGPSSSVEPPVARRLREAIISNGYGFPPFPVLERDDAEAALAFVGALPRRLPNLIDLLLVDHRPGPVSSILARAAAERWFFYLPERAHTLLTGNAAPITHFAPTELPTSSGVAVIARPADPALLLGWVLDPAELHVVSAHLSASRQGSRLVVTKMQPVSISVGLEGVETGARTALRTLAALRSIIPDRVGTSGASRDGQRAARSTGREPDDEETRVIYATRSTLGIGTSSAGDPSPRSGRWEVRGHWRNQWRPSIKEHERIWIAEHTAGAAEGVVRHRDRVYLLAPRAAQ